MRSLRILSLSLWTGSQLFFAIGVAPVVFTVLTPVEGGRILAGSIVGHSLFILHALGFLCGVAFLAANATSRSRGAMRCTILAVMMLLLTALSQFVITPRLDAIRARGVSIDRLPPKDPQRVEFDRLHRLSTADEGVVFVMGIMTLLLVIRHE